MDGNGAAGQFQALGKTDRQRVAAFEDLCFHRYMYSQNWMYESSGIFGCSIRQPRFHLFRNALDIAAGGGGFVHVVGVGPSGCCWILLTDLTRAVAELAFFLLFPARPLADRALHVGVGRRCESSDDRSDHQFLFHVSIGSVFGFRDAGVIPDCWTDECPQAARRLNRRG